MTLLRALPVPVVLKDILLFTIFDIAKFLVLCGKLLPLIALIASFFALRNALGLVNVGDVLILVVALRYLLSQRVTPPVILLTEIMSAPWLPILSPPT